jgi:hypothetical protein
MANEIAKVQGTGYLIDSEVSKRVMAELDGITPTLLKIKIPSGGGLAYEIPSDDPENPDAAKNFEAVIVKHQPVNVYYAEKYDGQKVSPDCYSKDGKKGIERETGEIKACSSCPLNEYGSGEGGVGKACQNKRMLYLLREGECLPVVLVLPSTSLKGFTEYVTRIISKGKTSADVVTKFGLKKAKSKNGIDYSEATFAATRALSEDERKTIERVRASLDNTEAEINE